MNVGRGYVMNIGRGYVIHNHELISKVGIELPGQLKKAQIDDLEVISKGVQLV